MLYLLLELVLAIPVITKGIRTQEVDFLTELAQSHYLEIYPILDMGEAQDSVMSLLAGW